MRDFAEPEVLKLHRLDRLVRQVARLYRNKRLRRVLGLRGRPAGARRLPEILTPDELRQILEQAYRATVDSTA